jgi:hypothetical protein
MMRPNVGFDIPIRQFQFYGPVTFLSQFGCQFGDQGASHFDFPIKAFFVNELEIA